MLIASDLHIDTIDLLVAGAIPVSAAVPLAEPFIGAFAFVSITNVLFVLFTITFGSPGLHRALVMPDPCIIPVD